MPRIHKILLASFLLILSGSHLQAFEIDGRKWPTGEIEFYVSIDGMAASASLGMRRLLPR